MDISRIVNRKDVEKCEGFKGSGFIAAAGC